MLARFVGCMPGCARIWHHNATGELLVCIDVKGHKIGDGGPRSAAIDPTSPSKSVRESLDDAQSEAEYLRQGIEDALAMDEDRRESFLRRLLDNVDACGSFYAAKRIAAAESQLANAREELGRLRSSVLAIEKAVPGGMDQCSGGCAMCRLRATVRAARGV